MPKWRPQWSERLFIGPCIWLVLRNSVLASLNNTTMMDYHGFYRNVKVTQFETNWLTEGLTQLIFFTCTNLSPTDSDAAYTSWGTYNSVSEQTEVYAPVALLDKGNTTVVAFGDITWLMDPWIRVGDNYQLAMNLVEEIVRIKNGD